MAMKVIREQEGVEAAFRVLECGCDEPNCDSFAIVGSHDPLRAVWCVLGVSGPGELEGAMARLQEGDMDPFVGKVCALVGCPFKRLLDPIQVALAQQAWEVLPDWMMQLEAQGVWELRGRVFGDDLVRVPAALFVLNREGNPLNGGRGPLPGQTRVGLSKMTYELPPPAPKGWWQG